MTRLFAVVCWLMLVAVTAYAAEEVQGKPTLRIANREIALSSQDAESLVKKVRPYAAMSELAYRSYSTSMPKKTLDKDVPKQRGEGWAQLEELLTKQQWEFLGHNRYRSGKDSVETVECDLWMNRRAMPPQVVVVFRGNDSIDADNGDDTDSIVKRDQDLSAALHTADLKEDVLEACKAAGPDVVLTAAGHSLGGALAQQLFYLSQVWPVNRVTQVIVFEPSLMTGVNEVASDQETKKAMSAFSASVAAATTRWRFPEVMAHQYGFGTIRVNETPESYLRWLSRPISEFGENYITALNFDFEDGGTQPSMAKLAQDLRYYPATPPAPAGGKPVVPPADPATAEFYRILNQS